jgi:hypothetical protein
MLPKDVKLFVKTPTIVETFSHHFQKLVANIVRQKPKELITSVYDMINPYFTGFSYTNTLLEHFDKSDVPHLKENLYTADYWMFRITVEHMQSIVPMLQEKYGDASIAGILATIRDTIM